MKTLVTVISAFSLVSLAIASPKTATLAVTGWTCGSCAVATRVALNKLEGVVDVKTDQAKSEVVVAYDDAKVLPESLIQAIEKLGYHATVSASPATTLPRPGKSPTVSRLEMWEPINPSFEGCSNGSCGTRIPNARVASQPGAQPGQKVYCPVSGVVLQITQSTPKREVQGKPTYLCCDGCARYFDANRDQVLGARGLATIQ